MGVYKMNRKVKIYGDGANINEMVKLSQGGIVDGLTTNPTLMAKAGINDYLGFAKDVLKQITKTPISFEVFSDELEEMYEQAKILDSLGQNVYVKIPVTNTKSESTAPIIKKLSDEGIKLNVTAIFTENQIKVVCESLNEVTPSIVSIFAGRIANAGIDPEPIMKYAVKFSQSKNNMEILWASPREVFNVIQAERCGCHIITMTPEQIAATKDLGKNLEEYSLETVKMFYDDAVNAGFKL
jgi:transaldolase